MCARPTWSGAYTLLDPSHTLSTVPSTTSYPIPGTKLTATFLGPGPSGFTPIFYGKDDGKLAMGSVNAGNSNQLYVGGGGINGAFAHVLDPIQNTSEYATRHMALYQQAEGGGDPNETYAVTDPMGHAHVLAKLVDDTPNYYDGIVFVDVFGPGLCPDGNALNTAMVYVAPPYGPNYDSDAAFLAAIETTAAQVAECVTDYNAGAVASGGTLPSLKVLRLSLYSSNIYNRTPKVSLDLIAMAIFDGLMGVLKTDSGGLVALEFPVAHHEFSAVEKHLQS